MQRENKNTSLVCWPPPREIGVRKLKIHLHSGAAPTVENRPLTELRSGTKDGLRFGFSREHFGANIPLVVRNQQDIDFFARSAIQFHFYQRNIRLQKSINREQKVSSVCIFVVHCRNTGSVCVNTHVVVRVSVIKVKFLQIR